MLSNGISKYNSWQWPTDGPSAGYIVAHPLPYFGTPAHFSSAEVAGLCNDKLYHPELIISTYTEPQSKWTIVLPKPQ
ncbi:9771_t:CDS:2, partial [Cetraspora pellucida]